MKKLISLIGCFTIATVLYVGCTTNQQTVAYKTLSATIIGVHSAYDGFLDGVVTEKIKTNDVPKVTLAYNEFQLTANTAVYASAASLTNITTTDIVQMANNVFSAIETAKQK